MMRRDILLHFYYHFGSSAGIAQVPRGGGGASFLYTTVLLDVAPLHGIRRTAKKVSYFPKIATAIIAKCTGWESWTLKVENQWEVQVGELA